MSKEVVEKNEQEDFDRWVANVHEKYGEDVAHFEHNLEVCTLVVADQLGLTHIFSITRRMCV